MATYGDLWRDHVNYQTGEEKDPLCAKRLPLECFDMLQLYNRSVLKLDLSFVELDEDACFAIGKYLSYKECALVELILSCCNIDANRAEIIATNWLNPRGATLVRISRGTRRRPGRGPFDVCNRRRSDEGSPKTINGAVPPRSEGCACVFALLDSRLSAVCDVHDHILGDSIDMTEADRDRLPPQS